MTTTRTTIHRHLDYRDVLMQLPDQTTITRFGTHEALLEAAGNAGRRILWCPEYRLPVGTAPDVDAHVYQDDFGEVCERWHWVPVICTIENHDEHVDGERP